MSTIDEALEKIEKGEETQAKDDDTSGEKNPKQLIIRAREIMGDVLLDFFQGELPGQSGSYTVEEPYVSIIKKIGLDLFQISPENYKKLVPEFNSDLDDELIKEMLKLTCGEYALKTDLLNLAKESSLEELMRLLPEFEKTRSLFDSSDRRLNKLATFHPYIVVMGMMTQYRPLATLAIERAKSQNRIELPTESPNEHEFSSSATKVLENITPLAQDYVEVAKEYGIKEILPIIKEFKEARDLYLKKWYNN